MKTANKVAIAVRLTDNAELPLAKWVMKFDIFPPGHAATMNMPKAILGIGSINHTKIKVIRGNNKNWLNTPVKIDRGFWKSLLKSFTEISRAIPNITNAKAAFNIQSIWLSKLILTLSSTVSVKRSGYFKSVGNN